MTKQSQELVRLGWYDGDEYAASVVKWSTGLYEIALMKWNKFTLNWSYDMVLDTCLNAKTPMEVHTTIKEEIQAALHDTFKVCYPTF